MKKKVFDVETWRKIGRPDIGSKMFYINGFGKKVYGTVVEINYNHKHGVELIIKSLTPQPLNLNKKL